MDDDPQTSSDGVLRPRSKSINFHEGGMRRLPGNRDSIRGDQRLLERFQGVGCIELLHGCHGPQDSTGKRGRRVVKTNMAHGLPNFPAYEINGRENATLIKGDTLP
ncbi:hypothetical protein C1H46_032952 [Malus baccata]|uniref:Uncharacterized protein n=1 Tax=Malus baccata TaxID=106549 RepID=A0A540L598_MALBA|nr:hypothetical protein C1H46_032952 [Malus baccata]